MKSGLIGAGRSTSSTSEKTRGKLSFVQFSGKKKRGGRGEKCELCKVAMMSGWGVKACDVLTWQASMLWVINLTMLEGYELLGDGIGIHDTK